MKVLLSALACCPGKGSEPGVGWNWVRRLAADHDVWVLTNSQNREEIAAWPEQPAVHWVFVGPPLWTSRRPLINWFRYYAWQLLAYRRARELQREVGFDIVHHVTIATWRLPTLLWRLGPPLIWGPIGGGQDIPPGFAPLLGFAGRLRELLRAVSQKLSRHDPLVRATLAHAHTVVAANKPTQALLTAMGRVDTARVLETAIEPGEEPPPAGESGDGTFRILWVGALLPRKALPLLLDALTLVRAGTRWRLDVVGTGSELRRWQRIARRLGLADRVSFLGRLPHREVVSLYRSADVLVFSSIRDTSGNVLLEAMNAAVPVVALAWSGTPEILTEECGILVEPRSPRQTARDLAEALERLAESPELRRKLGLAGWRRVHERFTWDGLVRRLAEAYRDAGAGSTVSSSSA